MDNINASNPAPANIDGGAQPVDPTAPVPDQAAALILQINALKNQIAQYQEQVNELTADYVAMTGNALPSS